MGVVRFKVSERGQMALPADARRRWGLGEGGSVEVLDLGDALVILPAHRGGVRSLLAQAVKAAGGYGALADAIAGDEPDLA